jgi:hypothetical protein
MKIWSSFLVWAGIAFVWGSQTVAGPVDDVQRWISHLNPNERHQAVLEWSDPERTHMSWIPGTRAGLALRAMRPEVQTATWTLLRGQLSPGGFEAVRTVLSQERILQRVQGGANFMDPGAYYFAVFGYPGPGPWSIRFEGHHLSLNLTYVADDMVSGTPLFIGSNPEPFDESSEPKVLLSPLLAEAATVAKDVRTDVARSGVRVSLLSPDDQKRVRQILYFYYQIYPAAVRDRFARDLDARLQNATFRYDALGLEIEGSGLHYYLQRQGELHFHSLLRDDRMDFGMSRPWPSRQRDTSADTQKAVHQRGA